MPVDSTHPSYDENLPAWLRARDVFAGEDFVKAGGERYLPRLDSQSDDEYNAYKNRASFFNATARTADGLVGLVFRRDPIFKIPETATGVGRALAAFVDDANLMGTSLISYAKDVIREVVSVGRAGSLIDWEEDREQRAFAVLYSAEQIVNWRTERVNGRNVLTLVVLRETAKADKDEFQWDEREQLRVLRLVTKPATDEKQPQSVYRVEVWQRKETKSRRSKAEWVQVESRVPLRLGKPLPLIPFIFHGPRNCQECVDKLPLADIIAVNLDHYRLNADYKHGLHFTALPTAWVSGFDKASILRIGSSTAWVAETPGATAGFLEFTGQGLTTFERAMDRDERLMAVLGSRMLEPQKRGVETAEAIELRQSGENSVLSAISISVSASLTQMLRWAYWWNSTEDFPGAIDSTLVQAQLNTDFSPRGLASDELTAIVRAWQSGAISKESMFELFRRGEVLPTSRTNEEEQQLILKNATSREPDATTQKD